MLFVKALPLLKPEHVLSISPKNSACQLKQEAFKVKQVNLIIVDDHKSMREELCSMINNCDGMRVIEQAAGGRDAVLKAERLNPDLIIMDVAMPDVNGIEAAREIHQANSQIRILALSNHTGKALVQSMLDAGASGYVQKDKAYEELLPAIRAVSQGQDFIGEGLE